MKDVTLNPWLLYWIFWSQICIGTARNATCHVTIWPHGNLTGVCCTWLNKSIAGHMLFLLHSICSEMGAIEGDLLHRQRDTHV
jgi:hypothetical protein